MLARAFTGLMLAAFTVVRLHQDLATPSLALCIPTLRRRFTTGPWAVVITTGCRPRWIRGTPTACRTECPTLSQKPLMSEATDITVSKEACRRMLTTRLATIDLCQDLT